MKLIGIYTSFTYATPVFPLLCILEIYRYIEIQNEKMRILFLMHFIHFFVLKRVFTIRVIISILTWKTQQFNRVILGSQDVEKSRNYLILLQ